MDCSEPPIFLGNQYLSHFLSPHTGPTNNHASCHVQPHEQDCYQKSQPRVKQLSRVGAPVIMRHAHVPGTCRNHIEFACQLMPLLDGPRSSGLQNFRPGINELEEIPQWRQEEEEQQEECKCCFQKCDVAIIMCACQEKDHWFCKEWAKEYMEYKSAALHQFGIKTPVYVY